MILAKPKFIVSFLACWWALIYFSPMPLEQVFDYALFSLLGVLGAIFANSTGAGGGVIFIPAFNELNFTEIQSIGTSFAIQCFGMTAGGLTWWFHYKHILLW